MRGSILLLLIGAAPVLAGDGGDLGEAWRTRVRRAWELRAGGEEAVAALEKLLADEEPVVRCAAAAALGRIGPSAAGAVPALRAALDDRYARCAAAKALARIAPRDGEVVKALLRLLRSGSGIVEAEGVRALRAMGGAAVPALLRTLADSSRAKRTRDLATRALGNLGERGVVALREALGSPDRRIRWAAILTLGDLGADAGPARDALLAVARGKDAWNTIWARCSLILVTGETEPHLDRIRAALHGGELWSVAIQAITRLGPRAGPVAPDLLRMLDEEDRDRRYQAAVALGELGRGGRGAIEELRRRDRESRDRDRYVREAIRMALEKLEASR